MVEELENYLKLGRKVLVGGGVGNKEHIIVKRSMGASVWDINNREYIDCTSQAGALNTGQCHPRVIEAVKNQLDSYTHIRTTYETIPKLLLADKLIKISPKGLDKVSFCLHGSVANEGAMKIAMRNSKGRKFICLEGGFHGRTLATMDASWDSANKFRLFSCNFISAPRAYCYRCAFGLNLDECEFECAQEIEKKIKQSTGEICGLILEPIQGNGGMIEFPQEFHKMVKESCERHGVTLIWDEIQTAFGRTGEMFAADYYKVKPDIIVFGKAIAGGFPLAGMIFNKELNDFEPGDHSFTFAHFPISMVAALATIGVIESENLLERTKKLGQRIKKQLNEMKEDYEIIGDVRGPGLMIGVEIVKNKKTKLPGITECSSILKESFKEGVIFGCSKYADMGNVIKIKPPLVIEESQIDWALDVLEKSIRVVK